MSYDDNRLVRLLGWLVLGNRRAQVVEPEDGGTMEEIVAFSDWFDGFKPEADAMYQANHGGGIPMSSSLLREQMEYEKRSKTLLGRMANRFYGVLDYIFDCIF